METKTFGKYTILSILGQGAMGKVYLAKDDKGNEVALKVIREEIFNEAGDCEVIIKRFLKGSRFALAFQHPHIVRTFGTGEVQGTLYLACEVVKGGALDSVIKKYGAVPLAHTARIMSEVLAGLEEIHRNFFIHRNIKPANVLLDEAGNAKISDLGMLRLISEYPTIHTKTGQIPGAFLYMSPEQINGERSLDIRCDLYAFGAMFYQCLCGKLPFTGTTVLQVVKNHIFQPVPKLEDPEIPVDLKQLVYDLLAKEPEGRPNDPTQALVRLKAMQIPEPHQPLELNVKTQDHTDAFSGEQTITS